MNRLLNFSGRWLLLAGLLLLLRLPAVAHPYHASIMELRYNAQKLQLEIALKVFSDDFEQALSKGQPTIISFDKTPKAQLHALVTQVLRRSVQFGTKPGEALPLTLLGIQHENDAQWLYFSVKLPKPTQRLTLRHSLLLDTFPDQMNVVNLEAGKKKETTLFREGEEVRELAW